MFFHNPFAELSASVSPLMMQVYVAVMAALVVLGTLYDMRHKRSGQYFFANWRKTSERAGKRVATAQAAWLAIEAALEGLVSGEFCNARRRIAHLLAMYGFLAYAAATVIMVFRYSNAAAPTPSILPLLWHIGALMILAGGLWFWFFIRVDVAAEGHSPFRVVQADLFIVALLKSAALALIWSGLQWAGSPLAPWVLGLYLIATTVLFGSVPWSKFSHMFYKPAAAVHRRVEEANGSRRNLPLPADKPLAFGGARGRPVNY